MPTASRWPVDGRERAVAGDRLERLGARAARARAPAAALTIASASGCSLSRSTARDEPQELVLVDAVGGRDRDDLGLARA